MNEPYPILPEAVRQQLKLLNQPHIRRALEQHEAIQRLLDRPGVREALQASQLINSNELQAARQAAEMVAALSADKMIEASRQVTQLLEKTKLQELLKDARLVNSPQVQEALQRIQTPRPIVPPSYRPILPAAPTQPMTEEQHYFASAQFFIVRLKQRYDAWLEAIPEDVQPVLVAILNNGLTIRVNSLTAESHHAIAIDGTINGNNPCCVITHQSSLQVLFLVEQITAENPRRQIGFLADFGGEAE